MHASFAARRHRSGPRPECRQPAHDRNHDKRRRRNGEHDMQGIRYRGVLIIVCALALSACGHSSTPRSEEHTSELQSLMRISYAVFCFKKKKREKHNEKRDSNIQDKKETVTKNSS